jgi:hypothetical protein
MSDIKPTPPVYMLHIEPIFCDRPDPWQVVNNSAMPFSLTPEASAETRKVKLGCSFRECDIYLEVPTHWNAERVSMAIARFRHRFA